MPDLVKSTAPGLAALAALGLLLSTVGYCQLARFQGLSDPRVPL